jgi:hypothetical protein
MTKRRALWIIFGVVSAVCVITLTIVGLLVYNAGPIIGYLCKQRNRIATLDVRNQRRIVLTADSCYENDSRPIYYEVSEADRVVTPTSYIGNDDGKEPHSFTTFYAEGESLVAILETTATPPKVVIMQDFNSGESWPRLRDNEVAREEFVKRKWQGVFDRLRRENPQLPTPEYLHP